MQSFLVMQVKRKVGRPKKHTTCMKKQKIQLDDKVDKKEEEQKKEVDKKEEVNLVNLETPLELGNIVVGEFTQAQTETLKMFADFINSLSQQRDTEVEQKLKEEVETLKEEVKQLKDEVQKKQNNLTSMARN